MSWVIPAKTFLLGEYLALSGHAAILLCTKPLFRLACSAIDEASIHPLAPASRYWRQKGDAAEFLSFSDPYHGIGGFGASSAQFLGAYLEVAQRQGIQASFADLLKNYDESSDDLQGRRPSGYDLIAQASASCVYIDKNKQIVERLTWPFENLGFVLFHTGQKLATHDHLKTLAFTQQYDDLIDLVSLAKEAFLSSKAAFLLEAVNAYHHALAKHGLIASHTEQLLRQCMQFPEVLAAKGCGAMGSDVILVLHAQSARASLYRKAEALGLNKIATEADLYQGPALIETF